MDGLYSRTQITIRTHEQGLVEPVPKSINEHCYGDVDVGLFFVLDF
ncbi:MAG TPA: hypothetical protein PLA43_05745 [Bryobacteraceae bacterium]|nr:hypothetical protein [Bryobacteraceae bacterium]HPU71439.1 hypothetical protein [Bryobacteraceae bacterium]